MLLEEQLREARTRLASKSERRAQPSSTRKKSSLLRYVVEIGYQTAKVTLATLIAFFACLLGGYWLAGYYLAWIV